MKEKLYQAKKTHQREGTTQVLTKSLNWASRELIKPAQNLLASRRGHLQLTIGDISADFSTPSRKVANHIQEMYRREHDLLKMNLNELEPSDVYFDIGANTGLYSCFASNVVHDGYVVAFEPNPHNVDLLKENSDRNGVNIEVKELAVSDSSGSIGFSDSMKETGSQIGSISRDGGRNEYQVRTASIDALVESGLREPNVVKIDIEGAESLALDGMMNTLHSSKCRAIFFEVHFPQPNIDRPSIADFDSSLVEIMEKLRKVGYNVEITDAFPAAVHVKAMK